MRTQRCTGSHSAVPSQSVSKLNEGAITTMSNDQQTVRTRGDASDAPPESRARSRRTGLRNWGATGRGRRSAPVIAGTLAIALLAAACSSSTSSSSAAKSSSSSSSSSSAAPSTSASTGPSSAELATLAAKDAKSDGPVVAVPHETIGYLRYVADDYADQEMYNSFVQAADELGWTVIQCNGAGVPATMAACMSTLIADHPAAIVNDGIPQSLIAAGLAQAKAAGIVTVYTSGTLSPTQQAIYGATNLYDAGYTTPDEEMGVDMAKYVEQKLASVSGPKEMIDQTYPTAEWGVVRNNGLLSVLKGTDIKIVASPQANPANLTQGTDSTISALLAQYPKTKVIWITFDGSIGGAAEAVQSTDPGKTFPNAPLVATFYADPQTDQLISQGVVNVAVNDSLQWCSWVAVDQLAQLFARKTPLSPVVRPNYGPGLDFWTPQLITKANVPSGTNIPTPPVNYVKFFTDKWHDEFKLS
jgi:ABC-type sugar transport system substrate-binding protein